MKKRRLLLDGWVVGVIAIFRQLSITINLEGIERSNCPGIASVVECSSVRASSLRFSAYLLFALLTVGTGVNAKTREEPDKGGLRGRVVVGFPDGTTTSASMAKVYVLFSGDPNVRSPGSYPVGEGSCDSSSLLCSDFDRDSILYTAGGEFRHRYHELRDRDKVLKTKHASLSEERDLEIAQRSLRYVSDAIAKTLDWATKHPRDAWQVRVVTPDDKGSWVADGLRPGSYDVVVRGTVSELDAVWFYSRYLRPGDNASLESARPTFFLPLQHSGH